MNFGRITCDEKDWIISCDAHVRGRLRRLFPQVSKHVGDTIRLSINNENCRDLLWFLERYPMEVEERSALVRGAKFHIDEETTIASLLESHHPPKPFSLALPPREYQSIGASLLEIKKGCLIADDVGLGKTVTAICPMAVPENLPALVVTLTHLPRQWEAEINRFAPNLSVHILKSGKPYDLVKKARKGRPLFGRDGFPDVIVANYHKLQGWSEVLAGRIRYVVFDEVQELRRSESYKYSAARHIATNAGLRVGLSATPIYNYGLEFFNVIDILLPGALGTREEFIREWCGNKETVIDPKAFGDYLKREGIMIRRTRKDVGRELPPVSRISEYVAADIEHLNRIKGSAIDLAKTILSANQAYRGEKFRAAEEFNMLMRQATGIAKAPYVAEFVRLLVESGEKVVLYGWHREVYSIWMERLKEYCPRLYTGTENPKQKEESKNAFVNGESKVLIISLRAGAGLDGLQFASKTVVFGELDWSPGVHEQCIGRVYRDGQKDPVMAYFLVSEDGSDPIVSDVVGIKRGQIEGVRDPDASLVEALEVEPGKIKRLAEAYLKQVGEPIPVEEMVLSE